MQDNLYAGTFILFSMANLREGEMYQEFIASFIGRIQSMDDGLQGSIQSRTALDRN